MAGEIQLNSTTFATESGGTVTVSNVDSAVNRQNLGLEIGVDVQQYDADTTKNDVANTFTANQIISVTDNTYAALRVTQLGTGNAIVVEDSTNPDSSPFVVDASGNCGIGTSSPASNLHVSSTTGEIIIKATASNAGTSRVFLDLSGYRSSADQGVLSAVNFRNQNTTDTIVASIEGYKEGTSAIDLGYLSFVTKPTGGSLTERMRIDSSGNIGAPSGTNIHNASDQRLKQNITDLSGCLQKVLSMRGVSFNWIDKFCDSEADKTLYGLIAQELQIIDSNLVDSFSDNTITAGDVAVENPLRVNEKFIIPMLVESIKEQQALIESQQSQIDALTARIEALETT
jgi:hypothetical protein